MWKRFLYAAKKAAAKMAAAHAFTDHVIYSDIH